MPDLLVAYVKLDWCLDECICEGDRMDCCHVNQAAYSYAYSDIDHGDEEDSDSYASDPAEVDYGYSSTEDDDNDHDEEGFSDDDNSSEITRKCVVLGGLSEATDLTLISGHEMVHFFNLSFIALLICIVHCSTVYILCLCVTIYLC